MKKLNIGGAVSAAPSKKKSEHPHVFVNDRLAELLRQYAKVHPEAKRLNAQDKTLSKDCGTEIRPLYFEHFKGIVPESATMITSVDGMNIKLVVKDRYPQDITDDEALAEAIGRANVEKYFHFRTKYAVDYDKVPEDKQEKLAKGIEELRVNLGIPEEAVTAKQYLEPNTGFHDSRTVLLTAEENQRLDALMPVVAHPLL